MLSTFFKIYIRAKLPFRFWGVSFRMNGVKERRGLVKKMGERDVLAEEYRITYQPRLFSINPTKIFPENLSLELKMGSWFHYQTVFPWICLLLLDGKSNPSWIFFQVVKWVPEVFTCALGGCLLDSVGASSIFLLFC